MYTTNVLLKYKLICLACCCGKIVIVKRNGEIYIKLGGVSTISAVALNEIRVYFHKSFHSADMWGNRQAMV